MFSNASTLNWKLGCNPEELHIPPSFLFQKATSGSNGYDLRAMKIVKEDNDIIMFDTFVKVQIPRGYVGDLHSRSSLHKKGLYLANGVGVIDSDYRDNIMFVFFKKENFEDSFPILGDRVGQLVVKKCYEGNVSYVSDFIEEENIERTGGFGSTG